MTDSIVGYEFQGEQFTPLGMREWMVGKGHMLREQFDPPQWAMERWAPGAEPPSVFEVFEVYVPPTPEHVVTPLFEHEFNEREVREFTGMIQVRERLAKEREGEGDWRFEVSIRCENAAFQPAEGGPDDGYDRKREVGDILGKLAWSIGVDLADEVVLRDVNGNEVGHARFVRS